MKLSELKLEDVRDLYMNYNEEDVKRCVSSQATLDDIKEKLMSKFGDVEIEFREDPWCDTPNVVITSPNWVEAHNKFTAEKQAWCDRWGSY